MLKMGRVGRGRGDRGSSAVEFAIVLPVLLLILLGILEFAFVMRDYLSVASATKTGARTASSAADAGPALCPPGLPSCEGTDTPRLAQVAVNAIEKAGSSMPLDQVESIWVYKANAAGFAGQATSLGQMVDPAGPGCVNNPSLDLACVEYQWNGTEFEFTGGGWNSETIDACIDSADAVGVYMTAVHPFFTGFFQATLDIQSRSVLTFEPLKPENCAPGKHA